MKTIFLLSAILLSANTMAATCQSVFENQNKDERTGSAVFDVKSADKILDCRLKNEVVTSRNVIYKGNKRLCVLETTTSKDKKNLLLLWSRESLEKYGLGAAKEADKMKVNSDEHSLNLSETRTNGEMYPNEVAKFSYKATELSSVSPKVKIEITTQAFFHKKDVLLNADYDCSLEK